MEKYNGLNISASLKQMTEKPGNEGKHGLSHSCHCLLQFGTDGIINGICNGKYRLDFFSFIVAAISNAIFLGLSMDMKICPE